MTKSQFRMGIKTTARSVSPRRGRTLDTPDLPDFILLILSILSEMDSNPRDRIDRINRMKFICDFGIRHVDGFRLRFGSANRRLPEVRTSSSRTPRRGKISKILSKRLTLNASMITGRIPQSRSRPLAAWTLRWSLTRCASMALDTKCALERFRRIFGSFRA